MDVRFPFSTHAFSFRRSLSQPLELAARLNRKEMFYHILFKNREIMWQYGSRVNYNLDLRVVDGAPRAPTESKCSASLLLQRIFFLRTIMLWSSFCPPFDLPVAR